MSAIDAMLEIIFYIQQLFAPNLLWYLNCKCPVVAMALFGSQFKLLLLKPYVSDFQGGF